MNKIHVSIQHILQDLKMISTLLRRKSLESIFVDIYSMDPIILKSSRNQMIEFLESDKSLTVKYVDSPNELERFINGSQSENDLLINEPLTNFSVFDSMSAEMIQISRYSFLLNWQKKIKGLIINPLTLLLTSRGRVFLNIALLFITLYAYKTIPSNPMIQYFLGASSPIYYGLWVPYLILLLFDARYLSRLYLLISEMSRRDEQVSKNGKQEVVLLDPSLMLSKESFSMLQHAVRRRDAHLVRFTDQQSSPDTVDMVFKVPTPSDKGLLKYMGVLSGLTLSESGKEEVPMESIEFHPMEASVLEAFIESNLLATYTPRACHKLVVNYEYLTKRFNLTQAEKTQVAEILLKKFAQTTAESSIGFESKNLDSDESGLYSRMQAYL